MADSHSLAHSSFFALLIGIDNYPNSPSAETLTYAVADANEVRSYLREVLEVPSANIRALLNRQATHNAIITNFRDHLTRNTAIRRGDPIIIFYAGHGTRYRTPEGWTESGSCEAICPSDRGGPTAHGPPGQAVSDILDLSLELLLYELATVKGDNITVIMDCCYSGSSTHPLPSDVSPHEIKFRYAPPLPDSVAAPMFLDAERLLSISDADNNSYISSDIRLRRSSASRILLTPCRRDETACEWVGAGSGVFTYAVLEALRRIDISHFTYATFMNEIDIPGPLNEYQRPRCEGRNQDRSLFDGKALGVNTKLVPIVQDSNGEMMVEAGAIHGVVRGTRFTIRSTQYHHSLLDLGVVVVTEVYAVWSVVEPISLPRPIQPGNHAMVIDWANYDSPFKLDFSSPPVNTERQKVMEDRLEQIKNGAPRGDIDLHMVQVDDEDTQVIIYVDKWEVVLERTDDLILDAGCPLDYTWLRGPDHDEFEIINIAARFNFHLYRQNIARPYCDQIKVGLVQLSKDMQPTRGNHISGGRADLDSDPNGLYALIVKNSSDIDLWCSLFYFDPQDYSITNLYTPPSRAMRPPLHRHSDLTFGYGNTGLSPFRFTTQGGETHDSGFMKLFVSDEYADLSLMAQDLSFILTTKPSVEREGHQTAAQRRREGGWDTLLIIVDVR